VGANFTVSPLPTPLSRDSGVDIFQFQQCSQPSGAPVGPGGGTAKSPGRDGAAGRGPSSSFIPTCRATLENDRTGRQNAVRSRPRSSRTAVIRKDDKPHDVRHLLVWDGKCLHRTAGDDGGRQGTAENSGRPRGTTVGDGEDRGRRGRQRTTGTTEDDGDDRGQRGRQRTTGTTGDDGGRRGTTGDDGGRRGTTGDGGGRHNVVRPRPGPGRTDCPGANTEFQKNLHYSLMAGHCGPRKWPLHIFGVYLVAPSPIYLYYPLVPVPSNRRG